MDCLKSHNLWFAGVSLLQQLSEVSNIIVAEYKFLGSAVPDALDHWGMVSPIRVDLATWVGRDGVLGKSTFQKTILIFSHRKLDWPGSIFARVKRVESLATKQEVKSSAASFLCRSASSCSSSTWNLLVPEIFLVPPAPEPCFCKVSLNKRGHAENKISHGEYDQAY